MIYRRTKPAPAKTWISARDLGFRIPSYCIQIWKCIVIAKQDWRRDGQHCPSLPASYADLASSFGWGDPSQHCSSGAAHRFDGGQSGTVRETQAHWRNMQWPCPWGAARGESEQGTSRASCNLNEAGEPQVGEHHALYFFYIDAELVLVW